MYFVHHRNPSVERLSFHLPDQQYVIYNDSDNVSLLLEKPCVCESQFLAWMALNKIDTDARKLTYSEFPNKYVYNKAERKWKKRKRGFAIGRTTHISISAGELYYLRVLLTHVKGPTCCFDDIKTVEVKFLSTFLIPQFAFAPQSLFWIKNK